MRARLEAFILQYYLARNVLSPHAMELLDLQAELEDVLLSDDSEAWIISSQTDRWRSLMIWGLGQGSTRLHLLAPRVSASATWRAQEDRAAQTRLTLVTARAQGGPGALGWPKWRISSPRVRGSTQRSRSQEGVSALRAAQRVKTLPLWKICAPGPGPANDSTMNRPSPAFAPAAREPKLSQRTTGP